MGWRLVEGEGVGWLVARLGVGVGLMWGMDDENQE